MSAMPFPRSFSLLTPLLWVGDSIGRECVFRGRTCLGPAREDQCPRAQQSGQSRNVNVAFHRLPPWLNFMQQEFLHRHIPSIQIRVGTAMNSPDGHEVMRVTSHGLAS